MTTRDMQRTKIRRAEESLLPHAVNLSNDEATRFATKVVNSRWFQSRLAPVDQGKPRFVTFTLRDGCSPYNAGNTYVLGSNGTRLEILHSLTHVLTATVHPPHDRAFARMYLAMVRRFIGNDGPEGGTALRKAFNDHKIRARVVSDDTREKHRERFYENMKDNVTTSLLEMAKDLEDNDGS